MCKVTNAKPEFAAQGGETWYLNGEPYTIGTSGCSYFETNGNPETLYLNIRDKNGKCYIITHKAFMEKATKNNPIKDVFVTPRDILNMQPCDSGVVDLAVALDCCNYGVKPWEAALKIQDSGRMDCAYTVNELYRWYMEKNGGLVPNSYLLFLARKLNMIPKVGNGPNIDTVKRLLGIKE